MCRCDGDVSCVGHDLNRCSFLKKECYEEEVQPYRKTDYKPMIYNGSEKFDDTMMMRMDEVTVFLAVSVPLRIYFESEKFAKSL